MFDHFEAGPNSARMTQQSHNRDVLYCSLAGDSQVAINPKAPPASVGRNLEDPRARSHMKKIIVSAGLALALIAGTSTAAFAYHHRHSHMECHWHHHHRDCHRVWD